jgi:hypothetical protein
MLRFILLEKLSKLKMAKASKAYTSVVGMSYLTLLKANLN